MAARRKKRHRPKSPKPRPRVVFERFTEEDALRWTEAGEAGRRIEALWSSDLAYQRSLIADQIRLALLGKAEAFKFEDWQRVGRYKYALTPLSVAGSLKYVGGRFNIADIDRTRFPPFPALYLAIDRETAMQEVLGQDAGAGGQLDALELALAKPDAIFNVPVKGELRSVLDLRKPDLLQPFVDLIKDFTIDKSIAAMAASHELPPLRLIRTTEELLTTVFSENWRRMPVQYGVPAPPQIIGQLAADAGVEGIIFPSKFNEKPNIAVFPQNFTGDSFVELLGAIPAEVKVRRLDGTTAGALP